MQGGDLERVQSGARHANQRSLLQRFLGLLLALGYSQVRNDTQKAAQN